MKIIITSFALVYATSTAVTANSDSCSNMDYAYPGDIPSITYDSDSYIFTRQKYNSICVDSQGRQFEYGTIQGEYAPIDEVGGGCSTACVEGVSSDQARGCNQRPPSDMLVGFQYDCEVATCYCLYEAGTLGDQYSDCFDNMNTSNEGSGQVYDTIPQQGETCYSLQIQVNTPPVGTSICDYTPDYDCYIDGHPPCCSENDGAECPDYLTMCNNQAEGEAGYDYCTDSPNYSCFPTSDGQPSCCSEAGGPFMNCPQTQPDCDVDGADGDGPSKYTTKYLRSN